MATQQKDGKLIYHLTSLDNIESILKLGLLPRDDINKFHDVADNEIINLRKRKRLNNLVPFHFFAQTPFDGAVQKANKKKKFVFITIHRDFAKRNGFKILKQHPLSLENFDLLDFETGMEQIDWETMAKRDYDDHACMEICMAECLSEKQIMPRNFHSIYVPDEETKSIVLSLRDEIIGKKSSFYIDINSHIFVQ